jgi:hypothetical protein
MELLKQLLKQLLNVDGYCSRNPRGAASPALIARFVHRRLGIYEANH